MTQPTRPRGGRSTRRQILATVALTDLPAPHVVTFDDDHHILSLSLDTIADGTAWAKLLGGRVKGAAEHSGQRWLRTDGIIVWHGWTVQLTAHEPVEPATEPLDDATVGQLAALVDPSPAAAAVEVPAELARPMTGAVEPGQAPWIGGPWQDGAR